MELHSVTHFIVISYYYYYYYYCYYTTPHKAHFTYIAVHTFFFLLHLPAVAAWWLIDCPHPINFLMMKSGDLKFVCEYARILPVDHTLLIEGKKTFRVISIIIK